MDIKFTGKVALVTGAGQGKTYYKLCLKDAVKKKFKRSCLL